jgi:hypothetical protein
VSRFVASRTGSIEPPGCGTDGFEHAYDAAAASTVRKSASSDVMPLSVDPGVMPGTSTKSTKAGVFFFGA